MAIYALNCDRSVAVWIVLRCLLAMKILDLCEFYSTRGGGVRSYLTRMAGAASALGHELVVVAPGARDEELVHSGGRFVHYRGPRMPYDPTYHAPLRVDRMRAIVERERPDVLQVSSPFLPALVARSLPRDCRALANLRASLRSDRLLPCTAGNTTLAGRAAKTGARTRVGLPARPDACDGRHHHRGVVADRAAARSRLRARAHRAVRHLARRLLARYARVRRCAPSYSANCTIARTPSCC